MVKLTFFPNLFVRAAQRRESSDVILVGERLTAVVEVFHIGRSAYRKTAQNLMLAFVFNGVGVPAATIGWVHPVWAMIAMVASVSTVLLNSFLGRLLPKPREVQREQSEVRTLELHIPSMHCEGCLNAITQVVTQFPEVLEVQGDLKKKIVSIRYQEDHATPDRIRRAIDEAGFPAG